MKIQILITTFFIFTIFTSNAQIKFSDLEHSFVNKTKKNKSGVISTYNGTKFTGTTKYYEKTRNEQIFYTFKNGIITEHLKTRNDSVFIRFEYEAGYIKTINSPHWLEKVEHSSISFLSDNKIDSMYWFLSGELLSKIYYTYPEPNIKTESFYDCLNQSPVLTHKCFYQYENDSIHTPIPSIYPLSLNTKMIGKETDYDPITGVKIHENEYEIIDFKSTKVSSIDFDDKGNEIKKEQIKGHVLSGMVDYDKLTFVNQKTDVNDSNINNFIAIYNKKQFSGIAKQYVFKKTTVYPFLNGKLHGKVETKFSNNIIYSCNFIDGKKDGMEFSQYSFNEGQIHFDKLYYSNGKLDSIYHYNNRLLYGKVIYQYPSLDYRIIWGFELLNDKLVLTSKLLDKIKEKRKQDSPLHENILWTRENIEPVSFFVPFNMNYLKQEDVYSLNGESSEKKLTKKVLTYITKHDTLGVLSLIATSKDFNETFTKTILTGIDRDYYIRNQEIFNSNDKFLLYNNFQYELFNFFSTLKNSQKKVKIIKIEEDKKMLWTYNGKDSKLFIHKNITFLIDKKKVQLQLILFKTNTGWKICNEIVFIPLL